MTADVHAEPALVSFVIPVRDDAVRLERCLASIRANRYPADRVQIIVADNGSSDDSVAVASRHGATILSLPDVRLGALRNAAAARAQGTIIAFVDADHAIDADWISRAVAALQHDGVVGVGAACHPPEDGTWVQETYDWLRSHRPGVRPTDWLGTGNLAIRRSAFEQSGGFDVTLETCEDVDLCRRLRQRGGTLMADGALRNIHYGDPGTIRQVFVGEMWRGRDNLRVSVRSPLAARMVASAIAPIVLLLALAAIPLGLVLPHGLLVSSIGAGVVAGTIVIRALLMLRRAGPTLPHFGRAIVVAAAYESGRALAVIGRLGYGRRRRVSPGAESRGSAGSTALLALVLVALGALYWNVGRELVHAWIVDGNYSHGFLIVPVAAYFVWERRAALARAPLQPSPLGLAVLAFGVMLLLAGLVGAELFLSRISLLFVLAGAVLFVYGWKHLRILAFPLAFLILMIPIPAIIFNQIAFPLQLFASRVGETAISAANIPVLREGNVLVLANTSLEVAEACSGIRSLVSLITLGIVYGYIVDSRGWVRTVLTLSTIPIAIIANGGRVAGTGIAAHVWGPAAAEGFFHEFSGWVVFVAAFALLLAVHQIIRWIAPRQPALSATTAVAS